MARAVWTGVETGSGGDVVIAHHDGTVVVHGAFARSGTYGVMSMHNDHRVAVPGTGHTDSAIPLNLTEVYHRFYLKVSEWVSGIGASFVRYLATDPGIGIVTLVPTASGTLEVLNNSGTPVATGTTVLSTNRWYRVELHVVVSTTNGVVELRLDGAPEASATGLNLGSLAAGYIWHVGHPTGRYIYDDIAVDDATWPGEGSVWSMVPHADGSTNGWIGDDSYSPLFALVRPYRPYGVGLSRHIHGPSKTNQVDTGAFLRLSAPDMHLDLQNPNVAFVVTCRSERSGVVDGQDTLELGLRLYLDDETTPVSNEVVFTNPHQNEQRYFAPITITYPLTRQAWNRLAVRLRQGYAAQGGEDSTAHIKVMALSVSLELPYTPRPEVAILGVV